MSVKRWVGGLGVVGSRLCCQRKVDSCSLMERSLFVLQTFLRLMNTSIQSECREPRL